MLPLIAWVCANAWIEIVRNETSSKTLREGVMQSPLNTSD
jgi:hypothetical protein